MDRESFSLIRSMSWSFWGVIIGAFALLLVVPTIFFANTHSPESCISDSVSDWGSFGDYFGGVLNPLLSFLAFVFVLVNVRLQIIELRESREEARESNEALRRQTMTMESQLDEAIKRNQVQEARSALVAIIDWRVSIISTYQASSLSGMQRIEKLFEGFVTQWGFFKNSHLGANKDNAIALARELKRYITWYSMLKHTYSTHQNLCDSFFNEFRRSIRNGMSANEIECLHELTQNRTKEFSLIFSADDFDSLDWILDTRENQKAV